jgi:hypothetical protein
MSIIEFIGFIISMGVMGIMYLRRMKAERYRREHPEEFPEEYDDEDEEMEAYQRSFHRRVEGERTAAVVPPHPALQAKKAVPLAVKRTQAKPDKLGLSDKSTFQTSMAGYRQASDGDNASYEVEYLRGDTRAKALIKQLSSPQDIILLKEILGPPKAMQKSWGDPVDTFDERP